jgi:hypothetical protein
MDDFVLSEQSPYFNVYGVRCAYCGMPWVRYDYYEHEADTDHIRLRLDKRCGECGSPSFYRPEG